LLAIVVVSVGVVTAGPATADDARLETVTANGYPAVSIVAGVPAVGNGPAIRRYHDSGRFDADRAAVVAAASAELQSIVATSCPAGPAECKGQRLAIVVDIDDTLLDWYPAYARHRFDLPGAIRQAGVRSCVTRAISPTRALVNEAERLGVAVLIVTGRRSPVRAVTKSCLERRGVSGWDALVLRNAKQDRLPAATYKQQAYDSLAASGWNVALSIGDQSADMVGTPDTARFLLPNPLYRTD
jgi:hypothetical protein